MYMPSAGIFPPGFSMEYQIYAAAPPAASKTISNRATTIFKSAALLCRGCACQVFAQNHHRGHCVHGVLAVRCACCFLSSLRRFRMYDATAQFFLENALGLPTRQPFV